MTFLKVCIQSLLQARGSKTRELFSDQKQTLTSARLRLICTQAVMPLKTFILQSGPSSFLKLIEVYF
jgi:hypothetical protein